MPITLLHFSAYHFLFVLLYYKTKGWPQTKKPVLDERVYP